MERTRKVLFMDVVSGTVIVYDNTEYSRMYFQPTSATMQRLSRLIATHDTDIQLSSISNFNKVNPIVKVRIHCTPKGK